MARTGRKHQNRRASIFGKINIRRFLFLFYYFFVVQLTLNTNFLQSNTVVMETQPPEIHLPFQYSNVAIAAFTTAAGRVKLLRELDCKQQDPQMCYFSFIW